MPGIGDAPGDGDAGRRLPARRRRTDPDPARRSHGVAWRRVAADNGGAAALRSSCSIAPASFTGQPENLHRGCTVTSVLHERSGGQEGGQTNS